MSSCPPPPVALCRLPSGMTSARCSSRLEPQPGPPRDRGRAGSSLEGGGWEREKEEEEEEEGERGDVTAPAPAQAPEEEKEREADEKEEDSALPSPWAAPAPEEPTTSATYKKLKRLPNLQFSKTSASAGGITHTPRQRTMFGCRSSSRILASRQKLLISWGESSML